jgi:hypothetical protein
MTMMLAIPMAPTSSAMAPRPRTRPVPDRATASRAVSASEGRLAATATPLVGLAVRASLAATGSTRSVAART